MESTIGVLSRQEIETMLDGVPALVEYLPDRDQQLQPNGIDLTLESVSRFVGPGCIGLTNEERILPQAEILPFEPNQTINLAPGAYFVRFSEAINLPNWLMAYARPRSSLLRSGVALHTAVWDAGYSGRGGSLMVVYHPAGFRVARQARICQLVFHRLSSATDTVYSGMYQKEGGLKR